MNPVHEREGSESRTKELQRRAKEKGDEWVLQGFGEDNPVEHECMAKWIREKANEYIDLLGDFEAIKSINEAQAVRFNEVFTALPTMNELDLLLVEMEKIPWDSVFWLHRSKEESMAQAKKLRSAVKFIIGAGDHP